MVKVRGDWLRRLFFLEEGELGRLMPFFMLYFLLFSALALADGFSLALFLEGLGRERLPMAYGMVGLANLIVMAGYIYLAERLGSVLTFQAILGGTAATFLACWIALSYGGGGSWYIVMFAGREMAFTLVLMHFGTFLHDFFTRVELNRVLPIVYSGGRVGGILGGVLLQWLSGWLGLLNLIGVFLGFFVVGMALVAWMGAGGESTPEEDALGDPGVAAPRPRTGRDVETEARASMGGFLHFVWASPLLFWSTVTSILFTLCRWVLNFQYSSFFGQYFLDEVKLAQFLGVYTQLALGASLIIQLLIVNRLVAWIGIKGTYVVYSSLLLLCTGLTMLPMTLGLAVFARLVESELRFGLRNPIMQLITNKFSKLLRVRVRAWSLGVIIPVATLASSLVLGGMTARGGAEYVSWLGALWGLGYFFGSFGLLASFTEKKEKKAVEKPDA